ncbi:hypothetical protein KVT40_002286 [Elsinoe batatas]|uniref:Flavodoxin-like domain-containing protein n=1 Tax=Elsinoe batatas TaxID=2601811 RepID=A0A8K0L7K3_9PEZI|nr:hypothetical protein KVT40_002286 [Elsinoe batatas]
MSSIIHLRSLEPVLVNLTKNAAADDILCLLLLLIAGTAYSTKGLLWERPDPASKIFWERPQLKDGNAKLQAKKQTLAERITETEAKFVLLWGSQSGTSERFATRLGKELSRRFGFKSVVVDLGDCAPEQIQSIPPSAITFILLSTYGEGDPSDNTAPLWDWLASASGDLMSNLNYYAFGLGNSHYKHYNKVIDVVVNKLNLLGAKQLLPTGRADDCKGQTEEHFITWKDNTFKHLVSQHGFEEKALRTSLASRPSSILRSILSTSTLVHHSMTSPLRRPLWPCRAFSHCQSLPHTTSSRIHQIVPVFTRSLICQHIQKSSIKQVTTSVFGQSIRRKKSIAS